MRLQTAPAPPPSRARSYADRTVQPHRTGQPAPCTLHTAHCTLRTVSHLPRIMYRHAAPHDALLYCPPLLPDLYPARRHALRASVRRIAVRPPLFAPQQPAPPLRALWPRKSRERAPTSPSRPSSPNEHVSYSYPSSSSPSSSQQRCFYPLRCPFVLPPTRHSCRNPTRTSHPAARPQSRSPLQTPPSRHQSTPCSRPPCSTATSHGMQRRGPVSSPRARGAPRPFSSGPVQRGGALPAPASVIVCAAFSLLI